MEVERKYMARALQLAAHGRSTTSPNPMVGAVIVDREGRIIGEGWHRRYGEGHAEVNAVASVKDKEALRDATMYVTLEPCSHYGKTPPCAELIVRMGIPRVVVGCLDPFEKVAGRGVKMLCEAGVEVVAPFMERECRALNYRFITAHTLKRPYILLKWAQSADGYLDTRSVVKDGSDKYIGEAARWSTPVSSTLVHILRSQYDGIMVGSGTVIADNPSLTTRLGLQGNVRQPARIVADRRGRISSGWSVLRPNPYDGKESIIYRGGSLSDILGDLYRRNIISVIVEGGARLLKSFVSEGLWDAARIEITPYKADIPEGRGVRLPSPSASEACLSDPCPRHYVETASSDADYPKMEISAGELVKVEDVDGNKVIIVSR